MFFLNCCLYNFTTVTDWQDLLAHCLCTGEQRLWLWVRDWYRDDCQAGEVHVWQPREWQHQFFHTGWASNSAAGKDTRRHTGATAVIKINNHLNNLFSNHPGGSFRTRLQVCSLSWRSCCHKVHLHQSDVLLTVNCFVLLLNFKYNLCCNCFKFSKCHT